MSDFRFSLDDASWPGSDADLIALSLDDPGAFEGIFVRHAAAVFAFAAARVGPQHAEDVTAETFSTAFARREAYRSSAHGARPWLYGIAANKLLQHRAAEQRWLERNAAGLADGEVDDEGRTDARVDARRLVPELARALAGLDTPERDVLVMHVFGGLTHAEIADALGIRRGTAKARLSRGRARLRAQLEVPVGAAPPAAHLTTLGANDHG